MNLKLGAGGDSCDWNSGGIVRGGGGGVRFGISTGDKRLFYGLNQLASKARTDLTRARHRQITS